MPGSRPLFWLNVAAQVAIALFLLLTGRVANIMVTAERLRFPHQRASRNGTTTNQNCLSENELRPSPPERGRCVMQ
jgi:hypothetical protein